MTTKITKIFKVFIGMKYILARYLIMTMSITFNWSCNQDTQNDAFNSVEILNANNNQILNGTTRTYLDTIIYVGLKELKLSSIIVAVNDIDLAPKNIDGIDNLEAYVVQLNNNTFMVYIRKDIPKRNSIKILSHEMIHIQQYVTNKLQINFDGSVIWDGGIIYDANNIEYSYRPWEMEAFNGQYRLATQIESVLYN